MKPVSASENRNSAVVMGGGLAGLAAARVLSDHYSTVLVLEQDRVENVAEYRRGVPQSRHAQGLLASGAKGLEQLFPGLLDELLGVGAVKCCMTREAHWCHAAAEHFRFDSRVEGVLVSRPLLEGLVRKRVRALSNVNLKEGSRVKRLVVSPDNSGVTGVEVQDGDAMPADLTVDATGRGSCSPQWLQSMGYGAPEQETITVNLGYVTRHFHRLPHHLNGALLVMIQAAPENGRGGVLLAQEGELWVVTLNSYGEQPPTDLPAFIEFAKGLRAPYIYDVVSQAEPVDAPRSARFPASVRWRYERMRRFPKGYVIIGDALVSSNPAYALGMSLSILEAIELDAALRHGSRNLAHRFLMQVAKVIDFPWSLIAGRDPKMPGAIGRKPPMADFLQWYVDQLHMSARTDPRMVLAFQRVQNLVAPAQSLFSPRIAARVMSDALLRRAAKNRAARIEAFERGAF
jgi:2-polyprenyl-6-methoxyphenol hydroxylase-like FAD-dependent oxidoreductase